MNTRARTSLILFSLALLMLSSLVGATDRSMSSQAVAHFSSIGAALAGDSASGAAEPARALLALLDSHVAEMEHHDEGSHHAHDASDSSEHARMRSALETLGGKNSSLEAAREAYKTLASSFVPMARGSYEKRSGDPRYAVMSCPMVGASWIQVDGTVANPFYGSQMATCGEKVAELGAAGREESAHDDHHEGSGHQHHDHR